ncbi:uncharacterized SAM-binding protein YcdF (DUF218 family) [Ornithinicoccus hortensis]|uniref:Uncharacterized SAM-binding protein YcdF (DUF218 family) n=1 Tax=Ornithinicoccus hortensis TaxID=82346 RepID=A0A542YWF6_9MICO|nr:uncharacterized SAM-binding protein YcdF (DUF218 family) [Ornithinicoccus hortensis]
MLVDAREPDLRRGLRQRGSDPRRLSSAVAVVGAVGYLVVSVVLTVVTLSPMVGGGLAVLLAVGLVVANLVLVGYLAYTGVVVVRREGHGLGNLLTLGALGGVAGLLLLLGLGIVLSWSWLVIPAVAGLAVSATFGLLLTAFVVYGAVYARQAPHPGMDAIVVLGSKVFGDRVPPLLAARIDRGLEILGSEQEAGRRPVLVLSGGQGSDEDAPEGAVMARYALREGADAELVRVEDRSRTTEENLTLSRDLLLGEGLGTSLVVTTNDFHAFRAAIIARELGLDAQVVGAPTARYYFPSAVLREFIAVLARSPIFHAAVAVVVALAAGALAWLVVR